MDQLFQQAQDVLPVVDENGNEGAQVQQHIEKQVAVGRRHAKEVLEQGQVAGAGDGQELRHTLDQPQENRG